MISSTKRFHGYGSLRYVYRHGQVVRTQLFSVKYILNHRRANYRLAVVVKRKVNKSAVARNRIRRRLYEAVGTCEEQIVKPYDLVISVFSDHINDLDFKKLQALVKHALIEAEVIDSKSLKPDKT